MSTTPERRGPLSRFQRLTGGKFSLRPDGEFGAADTAHYVFFGRLNGRDVAVKPHASLADASHEANMLTSVSQLGHLAVNPYRVIAEADGSGSYLLTDRMPGLNSAAGLPFQGPERQTDGSRASVRDISRTLGALHAHGVSHGDAQIKNFGIVRDNIDKATNRPRVVVYDLEKGGTDSTGHIKTDPFGHDLSSLAQSLAYKGFGGPNIDVAAGQLEESVLEPYHAQATSMGVPTSVADHATTTAYAAFLDKSEELSFAQHARR